MIQAFKAHYVSFYYVERLVSQRQNNTFKALKIWATQKSLANKKPIVSFSSVLHRAENYTDSICRVRTTIQKTFYVYILKENFSENVTITCINSTDF